MYKTVLNQAVTEEEIKKSRFISYIRPVKSEEAARDFIDEIKDRHRDATHNCSAYMVGTQGLIQKYDDDGEPQKTAGLPILEVIKNKGVTDVCIVVTRYFGGTLLGAGGLIRAYAGGANAAIEEATIVDMCPYRRVSLTYDYSHHGSLEYFFNTQGFPQDDQAFTDKVRVTTVVQEDFWDWFVDQVNNMTGGTCLISDEEEVSLPVLEGRLLYKNKAYDRLSFD